MPLTISPEKYNDVRQKVKENKTVDEVLMEQNADLPKKFHTVEGLMAYLDSLPHVPD